jgi:hypothetical protein
VALPVLDETRMRQALALLAAVSLLIGLYMAIAPSSFVDKVAPFGSGADHHFLRDLATYQVATGAALAMSIRRPSWRIPVLFLSFLQGILHTINHLVDIGDTDPGWLGPFDFVSLLLLTAVTGWVLGGAARLAR